jgi:hypothetical protein
MILKVDLNETGLENSGIDSSGSGLEAVTGSCEHGDELSVP